METREKRDEASGRYLEEEREMPGLGRWVKRNVWLLVRLFMVIVFTFGTTLIAEQFSYGLEDEPVEITAEQLNSGQLPEDLRNGDFVRVVGTADVGESVTPENIGTSESEIGFVVRYQVPYFYFRLEETGNNFLVQTVNDVPDFEEVGGERMAWEGQLANLGTVIFFSSTQEGLERAGLPHDQSIPVVEVGETPEAYRALFPTYSVVVAVWLASLIWLLWKRNTPFI